ncbi:MAG: YdcF family protein [Betaproteobacteria bacterium]|nr:YdcF family protein [Betaproteobacteria bacterium]
MSWLATNAIALLLLPPGSLIALGVAGLLLLRRRPRLGRLLAAAAFTALYLLSTELVSHALIRVLEPAPLPDAGARPAADAIVVLGASIYFGAPEYGGNTVSRHTLERVRYAARLYRETRKPILVTGGTPRGNPDSEASRMKAVLAEEFGVPVAWTEERSENTLQNARLSFELLRRHNIRSIYLVTHARHMPRARLAFERAGFAVVPAPTGYATTYRTTVLSFLPAAGALAVSRDFFHEVIGYAWYWVRLS